MKDNKIIEAGDLPLDDKVYMKKDVFGWRIVHPVKNEDGSYNYVNLIFGGWRNFISLIIVLIILGFLLFTYHHDVTEVYNYCKENGIDKFSIDNIDGSPKYGGGIDFNASSTNYISVPTP